MKETEYLGLGTAGLFLEHYDRKQRDKIYEALEDSSLENIPLVHIKNDMEPEELEYLCKKYGSPCLTIHENGFYFLDKWDRFRKRLFLETNYNDFLNSEVDVGKIGGFCVDLAHFKAAIDRGAGEADLIRNYYKRGELFACNHLGGYSYGKRADLHSVSSLQEFDYLKSLPEFVFGQAIAIEVFNPIRDQLKYKEYIINLLS